MSAVLGFPPPTEFSTCSDSDLALGFNNFNLDRCLMNEPTTVVGDPMCGNGIREGDEVCDCGSVVECTNPCCDAATCQLAANAQCSGGLCCSDMCQFISQGTMCRNAVGDCDIAELCDGLSSDCPIDDHILDGTPCDGDTGFCFSGSCPSYDQQCNAAFGK